MIMRELKLILITVALGQAMLTGVQAADATLTRDFLSADSIQWGDGRPGQSTYTKGGPCPDGIKAKFTFNISSSGWYEVIYTGQAEGTEHDLLVDGEYVWHYRSPVLLAKGSTAAKAGNIWLHAGKHVICWQRVGRVAFPPRLLNDIELRPGEGRPEASITANKTLVDIVRAGEDLQIKVTGGGTGHAATYEMLSTDLLDPSVPPAVVGEVSFPASHQPITQSVAVPCPKEGAFSLGARVKGGRDLLATEFPIGEYAVIDVRHFTPGSGKLDVVHTIDCVAQTEDGAPLPAGAFLECNGPTRVTTSKAGTYRESHDCLPPEAEPMVTADDPHSFSGFSYRIELPEVQVPYLIDVEFPDDDRRSVTINQSWIDPQTGGFARNTSYCAKSYETGGMQPLSFHMQHHRAVVWAASKQVILGVLSQQVGCRAAVSKITISRFDDNIVPVTKAHTEGARTFTWWYEEALDWQFLVNIAAKYPAGLVHDFVGLDRWARECRYFGVNGISACGMGYQSAFWRITTIPGYGAPPYDQARLAALICEKYGMAFTPEIYGTQWYMNNITLPEAAQNPNDVRPVSCQGALFGPSADICDLNALHPVVQKAWISTLGELADKLRDSPAFRGITVRADTWGFDGQFTLPSLNWGYGDWTIHQFEADTGVKVPGADGDPKRFVQRFEFLTSAPVKDRWVKWRCDKILDYSRRMRDRIQGDRKDLFYGIAGDFICDSSFGLPDSIAERALGCGVDVSRFQTEKGLAVIPGARYGFRNLGVEAQSAYDGFLDPANVDAGVGTLRAFAAYMNYLELAGNWPADKLGVAVKPREAPYYCSAALASGRSSLEKFAVVLAEQDTSFLRDGGNTDICGDPEIWNPWFAEYSALPALPFTPLQSARDPVAVWYRQVGGDGDFSPGFYFYAVNREQYPVKIDLSLDGSGKIVRLGTGETVATKGGALSLDLQPYELRAFRAASGARIASATTTAPGDKLDYVKRRLAFAQDVEDDIFGSRQKDVSDAERAGFEKQLDLAWDAFKQDHVWRVRTALSMAPALKVYEDLGRIPDGQVITAFPNKLSGRPREGHWEPSRPVRTGSDVAALVPPGENTTLTPSHDINPQWGGAQILMATNGVINLDLDVPADGDYGLKIGQVAKNLGVTVASLNGASLPTPGVTAVPNAPETIAFPTLTLSAGKAHLTLRRDGEFGIYAVQMLPHFKPIPNSQWSTIGPFPSFWGTEGNGRQNTTDAVEKSLATVYIPEDHVDTNAIYKMSDGRELRWTQKTDTSIGDLNDLVMSMSGRTGSSSSDVNYAVTYIWSSRDRRALLCLGVDWWANAYLNGHRISSDIVPALKAMSGNADFTSWHPHVAVLDLKKGVNTLLVKMQGGSLGSSLASYLTDDPDLVCTPTPPAAK